MNQSCGTSVWGSYGVSLKAVLPALLLLIAVCAGLKNFESNRIGMNGSEEYSLRGLIQAHGYSSVDMLGPVPLELPLLVDQLYRGRALHIDDSMLFSPRAVGTGVKLQDAERPVIAPALAEEWRHLAVRQLVYNPFSYSDHVRLGEIPSRQAWPMLIRLLPPRNAAEGNGPVVVTEIDGVVYFVPAEWLQHGLTLRRVGVVGKLIEPVLVALLWLVGWCWVRWATLPARGWGFALGAALPVGVGLWSVFYWGARVLFSRAVVLEATEVFFGLCVVTVLVPLLFSQGVRADIRRHAPWLLVAIVALFALTLGLIRSGSFIPTVDSFRLLSSENSPADSLALGFPVLLSAVGALGTVTGNGFVGTVFPLLFLSLVIVTAVAFWRLRSFYPTAGWATCVAALLLVLFYAATPMARLQLFYVNGHVFQATCLLLLLVALLESRAARFAPVNKFAYAALVFLLTLFVCMSRMEGSLMIVVLLASLLFSGLRLGPIAGRHLLLVVSVVVLLWGVLTAVVLDGQAFVSSAQYVFMSALAVALGALSLLSPASSGYRFISNYGVRLMVCGTATVVYAAHVMKPSHLGISSLNVLSNLFTPTEGWSSFWWWGLAIAVAPFLIGTGAKRAPDSLMEGARRQGQTVLLSFVLMALAATMIIGLFRQPYRVGWSDSANRIVFQLVPVFLVWLYGTIGGALSRLRWCPLDERGGE
jgi:hypothetical protein